MHGRTTSLRRFDLTSLLAIAALACLLRVSIAAAQQSTPGSTNTAPSTSATPAANSPAAAPAPREMPTPEQLEPGVNTSPSATEAPASSAAPAAGAADMEPRGASAPSSSEGGTARGNAASEKAGSRGEKRAAAASAEHKGPDRLQLDATEITGNRELPKVLYIVPWKRSDLGDLTGRPVNSLLDEVLQPLDRDVFQRENRYYNGLKPPAAASKGDAPGGAASKP